MKTRGALLILGLFCAPHPAWASAPEPEPADLIGLLLDDPIGFVLAASGPAPAETGPAAEPEDFSDTVATAPDPPDGPARSHPELAARAFDITYTFAYPDSVRRAGADR